jgi:hypothetical protein
MTCTEVDAVCIILPRVHVQHHHEAMEHSTLRVVLARI